MDRSDFVNALADFVNIAQEIVNERHRESFPNAPIPTISVDPNGQKYIRIVKSDTSPNRSVYCFIERETGNILFPAGWKKPVTKNPRGSIFDADQGRAGIDWHGAIYLKR